MLKDASVQNLVIRPCSSRDLPAVASLAALDSQPLPGGELLIAEANGELVAAVTVFDGQAIADPFRPTADVVSLLRLRLSQLADDSDERPRSARGTLVPALFRKAPRLLGWRPRTQT